MKIHSWMFHEPGQPMRWDERDESVGSGDVIIRVAGCGICHTDLGFYYEGVPTRHELPLTLGHEISGTVVETGSDVDDSWQGRDVVVPAVLPCGECPACNAGRGAVCPKQIFPGNDVHGGFATHVSVPVRGLCPVNGIDGAGLQLADLSVIADAVTTPYQAILRSELGDGDLAVFVGAGGVGAFGVQIAAAFGARVIAIDIKPERLDLVGAHGADLLLDSKEMDPKELKRAVTGFAKENDIPSWRWKIFETSGSVQGQLTAFNLVRHGAYLAIVGFTPEKVNVRLSNLMAFDAKVEGNWGCLPEHYPAAVDLVLSKRIALEPFIDHRELSTINETFADIAAGNVTRRMILLPEE